MTDSPRGVEVDATTGLIISPPGGRYKTYTNSATDVFDANGVKVGTINVNTLSGDYVSYSPDQSRNWSYDTAQQVLGSGYIAMSTYSASSEGGSFTHKQGPSGGVEFLIDQAVGKPLGRFQFGFATGISLNEINNKVAGTVSATLLTQTDYYLLNYSVASTSTLPAPPYTGPSYNDSTVPTVETTVPVSSVPVTLPDGTQSGRETAIPGGTTVSGRWQVKGAYYMLRMGPSVRTQISERFGMSASVGVAGAYAGTRYLANESFPVPNIDGATVSVAEESTTSRLLTGYYADFNLEWAANERTGLYGGVTTQKLANYNQTVGGRTAHIDVGSSVGLRGGVTIRF